MGTELGIFRTKRQPILRRAYITLNTFDKKNLTQKMFYEVSYNNDLKSILSSILRSQNKYVIVYISKFPKVKSKPINTRIFLILQGEN